ncbi:DUF6527 family protein [Curtobacterium sp. MCBD17_035]|uniref:DUF6527 family protein n=1 Tax=Curtobacterium sp. MCBD17_035 TaxID=2175673 RepID=UPI0015E8C7A4|nr:DUF6527 family protein [Curtobacterium sp. MCBD17_035]WIB67574.1 DUF6527 family protein [Curtobacterium sp. MCBD17_035]
MNTDRFRREDVEFIPTRRDDGVLYVTEAHATAVHNCACGCGMKVVTPLSPARWTITDGKAGPSLAPSVGNWQLPCKSHYWIRDGQVRWSTRWTDEQIRRGAAADRRAVEAEYRQLPLITRVTQTLRKWFRRR